MALSILTAICLLCALGFLPSFDANAAPPIASTAAGLAVLESHANAYLAPYSLPKDAYHQALKDDYLSDTRISEDATETWMLALLPNLHRTTPVLLNYLVAKISSEKSYMYARRVKNGFAARLYTVLAELPDLQAQTRAMEKAADALGVASDKIWRTNVHPMPPAERLARIRAADMPARRLALRQSMATLLHDMGPIGPPRRAGWKLVFNFLEQDAKSSRDALRATVESNYALIKDMEIAFDSVGLVKSGVLTRGETTRMALAEEQLGLARLRLLEQAYMPGAQPMPSIGKTASACATKLEENDRIVLGLYSHAAIYNDKKNSTLFNAGSDLRKVLIRQRYRVRAGGYAYVADELQCVLDTGIMYLRSIIPVGDHRAHNNSDAVSRQLAANLDLLRQFRDTWTARGPAREVLHAAYHVDSRGRPIWQPGGWLGWRWIGADEYADMQMDQRIVTGLGRTWLLPADSAVHTLASWSDVTAAHAEQVIVAIDPTAQWANP